ncbi:MAG: alpha/beta hydrolase [Nitrososphaerales archaeon]
MTERSRWGVMKDAAIENREVTWNVLDIPVNGTITAPTDGVSHPAVVFVAGSGPTDRDWCSPVLPGTNGSGKSLAEELAGRGFLTLRYDKLASGPHVRENLPKFAGKLSMQSHMDELAGAVQALVADERFDGSGLYALTNSEGAIHAVNYQLQARGVPFKGLVLTGAPGRAIGDVSRGQISAQARALPNADALMGHYDEAIADFLVGRPMVVHPSLPEAMKPFFRALENPTNLPFSRELWRYNLAEYIARVEEPMLVLIGKKDIQIDWKIDGGALERAAKKPATSFAYPDNANHVLKHEELPLEKLTAEYVGLHYNAPDARLDEEAANAIFDWLDHRTAVT